MKLRSEVAVGVGQASRLSLTSRKSRAKHAKDTNTAIGSNTIRCWQLRRFKSEIRSPKPERNPKPEVRNQAVP
jgi:hypothetical protein